MAFLPTETTIVDLIFYVLAVVGFALSVADYIRKWSVTRRRIEVTCTPYYAEPFCMLDKPKPENPDSAHFEIVNVGHRVVQIARAYIRLGDGSMIDITPDHRADFPVALEHGDRLDFYTGLSYTAHAVLENTINTEGMVVARALLVEDTLHKMDKAKLHPDVEDVLSELRN